MLTTIVNWSQIPNSERGGNSLSVVDIQRLYTFAKLAFKKYEKTVKRQKGCILSDRGQIVSIWVMGNGHGQIFFRPIHEKITLTDHRKLFPTQTMLEDRAMEAQN